MRTIESVNYPIYPSEMVIEQAQWPKLSEHAQKQIIALAFYEADKRNKKVDKMLEKNEYEDAQTAYDSQYKHDDYLQNQSKKEKRTSQDQDFSTRITSGYGYSSVGTLNLKNFR